MDFSVLPPAFRITFCPTSSQEISTRNSKPWLPSPQFSTADNLPMIGIINKSPEAICSTNEARCAYSYRPLDVCPFPPFFFPSRQAGAGPFYLPKIPSETLCPATRDGGTAKRGNGTPCTGRGWVRRTPPVLVNPCALRFGEQERLAFNGIRKLCAFGNPNTSIPLMLQIERPSPEFVRWVGDCTNPPPLSNPSGHLACARRALSFLITDNTIIRFALSSAPMRAKVDH